METSAVERRLFRAIATVPLAVERLASPKADASKSLLPLLEESLSLREYLRDLPPVSAALTDQIERALDTVHTRLTDGLLQLHPAAPLLADTVSEIFALDALGQERDDLLRDCEAYTGLERRELRLELALAARAVRRGKPRSVRLRLSDAELPRFRAVVRTLARELRDVEVQAAIPFDELHRSAGVIREAWAGLRDLWPPPATAVTEGRRPTRAAQETFEQFTGRCEVLLEAVTEIEGAPAPRVEPTAPSAAPMRRVLLVPRARTVPVPSIEGDEDWRTLLGRKGEWLVLQKQLARWRSLLKQAPERAVQFLGEIVTGYWRVEQDRAVREPVRRLLEDPRCSWTEDDLFLSLVWPASTGAGDAMGFDVFGLTPDLSDRLCLEVKTTDGPPGMPFEMTINEVRCARREGQRYAIARVSGVSRTSPRIDYWRNPALLFEENRLALMPVRFQVSCATQHVSPASSGSSAPGPMP